MNTLEHRIYGLSDNSLVLQLSPVIAESQIRLLFRIKSAIQEQDWPAVCEVIVTFHELTILFDSGSISFEELEEKVLALLDDSRLTDPKGGQQGKRITVPVCYDKEMALDKSRMVDQTGMSFSEIVDIHQRGNYLVYMLGFLPGFMYLGGLDEKLNCSRLEVPRQKVEKGSVGIADDQTGIYPMASPGGWNIIGRTPLTLFEYDQSILGQLRGNRWEQTAYIQPLDHIKFIAISSAQFEEFQGLNIQEFQETYAANL